MSYLLPESFYVQFCYNKRNGERMEAKMYLILHASFLWPLYFIFAVSFFCYNMVYHSSLNHFYSCYRKKSFLSNLNFSLTGVLLDDSANAAGQGSLDMFADGINANNRKIPDKLVQNRLLIKPVSH